MFNVAECQKELKQSAASKKTLKQLIADYPDSEAAGKAKKLLAAPSNFPCCTLAPAKRNCASVRFSILCKARAVALACRRCSFA